MDVRSIRIKLAVLVVTAVFSAVMVSALTSACWEAHRQFISKTNELKAIATTLATAVSPALARADRQEIAHTLGAVARMPDVRFARVTDKAGRSVQEFGLGLVVAGQAGAVDANPDIGPFSALFLQTYPVAVPIISKGATIGHLTLIADISSLGSAFSEGLVAAALTGLLAALVGLTASLRMQRAITAPVAELSAAMQSLGETKDYRVRLEPRGQDEIGQLIGSFNRMIGEISARDAALARQRDTLEIEVAERTRDLSEAKAAAEAANAAKSDFLAMMSHEIRTPMNGMLATAELMSAGELPPRLQRYANVLVTSGQSLLSIINDILDFSKIEAGKLELETVPLSPAATADAIVGLFSRRAEEKGLELVAYVAPDVPRLVAGDPVRLNQIVSNLVNNALKFTSQGSVSLTISRSDSGEGPNARITIAVTDTGIGIPADRLATIFDPFTQADQSTTRKFGGTGIGLTICNRLAHAMGGAIHVESVVGSGSTFSVEVTLPVLEAALRPVARAHPASRLVLVAVPQPALASVLARYATNHGFEPRIVSPERLNGRLLAQAAAVLVHASDLRHLRGGPAGPTAVILLAGLGESPGREAADVADWTLTKPICTEEVAACLSALALGRVALREAYHARATATVMAERHATLTGVRVLAADDSAINREVLIEALGRFGISVHSVNDGAAAVAAVKTEPFDLVFMDGNMPVMDGFEATRAIRAWEAETGRRAMPVVALTAHVIGDGANLWREAGMSDCVTKPFTLKALQTCLMRWLGESPSEATAVTPTAPRVSGPVVANAQGDRNTESAQAAPVQDIAQLAPRMASSGSHRRARLTGGAGATARRSVATVAPVATLATPMAPASAPIKTEVAAASEDAPLMDESVLDSVRTMQSAGDDLVGRVLALYQSHGPTAAARLRTSVDTGEAKAVAEAAHALKSLSRNIGARRVGDLCGELEAAGRRGELASAGSLASSIEAALRDTLAAIAARHLRQAS